jgi:hypothetical protein
MVLFEEKDKPNAECGNFRINVNKEDRINSSVKEWVIEWCKKYHPEAFQEAEKFIKGNLDK